MGKNFFFNDLRFDYSWCSINLEQWLWSCLVQFSLVTMAVLAIKRIVEEKLTFEQIKQDLLISFGLTAGFSLILALLPDLFSISVLQMTLPSSYQAITLWYTNPNAIVKDRASLLRADVSAHLSTLRSQRQFGILPKENQRNSIISRFDFISNADLFSVDKRYFQQRFIYRQLSCWRKYRTFTDRCRNHERQRHL